MNNYLTFEKLSNIIDSYNFVPKKEGEQNV